MTAAGAGAGVIHHGDCRDVMATLDADTFDAIVTDPPYGLEFMGKEWDKLKPRVRTDRGGRGPGRAARPRRSTFTCDSCGKRDKFKNDHGCLAGWSSVTLPDDTVAYATIMQDWHHAWAKAAYRVAKPSAYLLAFGGTRTVHRLACAIEDAGWIIRDMLVWAYASGFPKSKASLKPAWEPIVMARKPGPLRDLAIDACRIGVGDEVPGGGGWAGGAEGRVSMRRASHVDDLPMESHTLGRWPANILLTDPIFDGGWEGVVGGGETGAMPAAYVRSVASGNVTAYSPGIGDPKGATAIGYGDVGSYSRFFLVPKSSRSDREPRLPWSEAEARADYDAFNLDRSPRTNVHPTVKPTDLMRHLVRLVTPQGGTVLDPFLGSGSTGLACEMEGFAWVGIERELEYVRIAEARLHGTQRGMGLVG